MASYPIRFTDQIRQHLRALRKKRGLTQAQIGDLIGVSQARIAEIEANPGLISVEQLLKLFSALSATMMLAEDNDAPLVTVLKQKRQGKHNLNFRLSNMGMEYKTTYNTPVLYFPDTKCGRIAALSEHIQDKYLQNTSTGSTTLKSGLSPTGMNQKPILVHFNVNEAAVPHSVKPGRFNTDKGLQEKLRRKLVAKTKKGSW